MNIQEAAYWGSFAIPLVLLGLGVLVRSIVEQGKFQRNHFYVGLDLTIYFMAVVMIEFLTIADARIVSRSEIILGTFLLLAGIMMLVVQIEMHVFWRPRDGKMQLAFLGIFSNILGILLLYGFVQLKARGLV